MSRQKPPSDYFHPEPDPLPPEKLAAEYARLKAQFSAADLQRFTVEEDGIPMEKVLQELEEIHQKTIRERG